MLFIRDDQMRMLQAYMSKRFETRMMHHVQEFFPEDFNALGEEKVRREIKYGIKRASNYKITLEYDVCGYINMMFTLGRDYDMDPTLPWAGEILKNETLSGSSRLDLLYEEVEKYIVRKE